MTPYQLGQEAFQFVSTFVVGAVPLLVAGSRPRRNTLRIVALVLCAIVALCQFGWGAGIAFVWCACWAHAQREKALDREASAANAEPPAPTR